MEEDRADEDLMLAFHDGDVASFSLLYDRYKGRLYRYFLRQLGQAGLAEELFLGVWTRVIGARRRYQVMAEFESYIYHLSHNVLMSYYHHRDGGFPESYEQSPADLADVAGGAEPGECEDGLPGDTRVERLLALLDSLPEAERETLLVHEEFGLDVEGIARVTDVRPEEARNRLRYAHQHLRQGRDQV